MESTILITGAAGYIGGHIIECIINQNLNYKIIAVDDLSNANKSILSWIQNKPNIFFYQSDFADKKILKQIFSTYRINSVIHLAAKKYPMDSFKHEKIYWKNNVEKLQQFSDFAQNYNIENVIFSSSAAVYGEPKKLPIKENHILSPLSPYGETKLAGELIIKKWHQNKPNQKFIILRYFNPLGSSEIFKYEAEENENRIGLQDVLLEIINGNRNSFKIFGINHKSSDGSCIRDFIHIKDLANAHVKAILKSENFPKFDIFNIGTGKGYTILQLLKSFSLCKKLKINVINVGNRPNEISASFSNTKKSKQFFEWEPIYGINDMVESIRG